MTLYEHLRAYRRSIGAPWFDTPYDLNLLVLRSERVGVWDDLACLAYTDLEGAPQVLSVVVSAEASASEFTRPTHPRGCAYIRDGHYPGAYAPGKHNGRRALRQVAEMRYVRWTAGRLPTPAELEAAPGAFWDILGTHWHDRVDDGEPAKPLRGDTAACVNTLRKADHGRAMALVDLQEQHVGVGVVSPTFARMSAVLP